MSTPGFCCQSTSCLYFCVIYCKLILSPQLSHNPARSSCFYFMSMFPQSAGHVWLIVFVMFNLYSYISLLLLGCHLVAPMFPSHTLASNERTKLSIFTFSCSLNSFFSHMDYLKTKHVFKATFTPPLATGVQATTVN